MFEEINEKHCLDLLYRALKQRDALAWQDAQQCLHGLMYRWMRTHPQHELACRYDSEENYVAEGFARFWQTAIENQHITFKTLPAALQYLHMSLHSTIIDTLRKYARSQIVPLSELDEASEASNDSIESNELWEVIKTFLSNDRERRLAYLHFHCGLKPREIVSFCSQEFNDIQEVYRLRHNIIDRLQRNSAYLHWKLNGVMPDEKNSRLHA